MRFLHTGDLHIGKKLHGYDLLADQRKILADIVALAKAEKIDALVIAGDLYDRSVPPLEAIELLNQFVEEVNLQEKIPILAVSGNHDSATRLAAGSRWYQMTDFYLHTQLAQAFQPVEIEDTQFFLLPYFEPIAARLYFQDDSIRTLAQALERVVPEMEQQFAADKKQVLVAHFFVAGSEKSDSETKIEVGGLDSVPSYLLQNFDYVALGHLHNRNALQEEKMRYSGSPLKFSLSEMQQEKGVWLVDLPDFKKEFMPLTPLFEMGQLKGSFQELLNPDFYQNNNREDYLEICLTDQGAIPNMMNQLRQVYPRILSITRENGREIEQAKITEQVKRRDLKPQELMTTFFEEMTDHELTTQQSNWLQEILGEVQGRE
ncbi:exonuclease SbcD [Enterococcus sp. PF1-24]|uniref:exonuclease SbcCD subunit D n=1 Tax=unclassified Enterococcus TaxID=2608891 RepID=UPI00247301CA|nr:MULTISPECIES: exonuclease SbcCD subunit D [unclassified Enterococcus]MDH6363851.1 exonuclease SbcD [Enterococcus sp. PFB1-1]MDH6400963.1 exonuclease SbcD [Enterococcus sp. PF1-24]